jgi:hypothetical protein
MDPEIDFVTLLGTAGTGKTLLALAAGLTQTMDDKLYHEIVMTRETVPVGEDIGFLPGTVPVSYQRAFKFIISTSCFYPGLHFIAMRFPEVIRQGSRTTI